MDVRILRSGLWLDGEGKVFLLEYEVCKLNKNMFLLFDSQIWFKYFENIYIYLIEFKSIIILLKNRKNNLKKFKNIIKEILISLLE